MNVQTEGLKYLKLRGLTFALLVLAPMGIALLSPFQASAITADQMSFNVATDFNAIPNDGVNDAAAFQNALDTMEQRLAAGNAGVSLFIPKGTYNINSQLLFSGALPPVGSEQGLVIRGEGTSDTDGTVIVSSNANGALRFDIHSKIDSGSYNCCIQIEDIQFKAARTAAGPAVHVVGIPEHWNITTNENGTVTSNKQGLAVTPVLHNVKFSGTTAANYYTYGFKGINMLTPRASFVTMTGNRPGTTACLYFEHSYSGKIEDCDFSGADHGVWVEATSEGNAIIRSKITEVNTGFKMNVGTTNVPGPSPSGGGVNHSDIRAYQYGISITHKWSLHIRDNVITNLGSGAFTGIYLDDCKTVFVVNNTISGRNAASSAGIKLVNGAQISWPDYTTITYNDFKSLPTGISVGTNVWHTKILDNSYTSVATPVVNNAGSSTYISNRPGAARRAPIDGLAAVPTFPNTTWVYKTNYAGTVFNVKDSFNGVPGAVGDGVTDDTKAITNAVAQLIAKLDSSGKGSLYFPAGTYVLKKQINITQPAGKTWNRISIFGDGTRATVINAKMATPVPASAINVSTPNNESWISIHNMTIKANANDVGAAMAVTQKPAGSGANDRTFVLRDVKIEKAGAKFTTSLLGTGLRNPLLHHTGIEIGPDCTGIKLTGGCGFEADGLAVNGSESGTVGVDISTVPYGGNILWRASQTVALEYGVKINAGGGIFAMEGGHLDSLNNLTVSNASRAEILNAYTLNRDDQGLYTGTPPHTTFHIVNCTNVFIRDALFGQSIAAEDIPTQANTNRITIILDDNLKTGEVWGCMFCESGTGIRIDPGVSGFEIKDNRFLKNVVKKIKNLANPTNNVIEWLPNDEY